MWWLRFFSLSLLEDIFFIHVASFGMFSQLKIGFLFVSARYSFIFCSSFHCVVYLCTHELYMAWMKMLALSSIHWLFLLLPMLNKWTRANEMETDRDWFYLCRPNHPLNRMNEIKWNSHSEHLIELCFWWFSCALFCLNARARERERESFDDVSLDIYKIIKIVCILFQNSWNGSHFWFTFWRTIHKNYNSTMAITIITKYKWNQAKCQPAVVIKEISQNRTFQQAYAWTHHNEHWTKWTIPNGFSKRLFDILFILADYRLCYKHRMRLK